MGETTMVQCLGLQCLGLRFPGWRTLVALAALVVLAACESPEERAEKHFQRALELVAEGDPSRAKVEFRNVFKLNGFHREARKTYAALVRTEGRTQEAFGQYLRLVEQYPDDLDGQLALAEMALVQRRWEAVRRHGQAALALAPERADVRLIGLAMDYETAVRDNDMSARRALARQAEAMIADLPGALFLREVVIEMHLIDGDQDKARAVIDETLQILPEERGLYALKRGLLQEAGDLAALEAMYLEMLERFPEEQDVVTELVRLYLRQGEAETAEAFLRARVDPAVADDAARQMLIGFLREVRGEDTALVELDRLAADGTNPDLYRAIRTGILFNQGDRDTAIAELRAVIADAAPDTDQTLRMKASLARMLLAAGDRAGAEALVDQVLTADSGMVAALKMRARWQIQGDDTDAAISLLRAALADTPEDPELMTLMADAHIRNGSRELAGDLLAQAVDVSGNRAAETLRYVRFLTVEGRDQISVELLEAAGRRDRNNVQLVTALGEAYTRVSDWSRAEGIETMLRRAATPETLAAADRLRVRILAGQERQDDVMSFLGDLAEAGDGNDQARVAILRTHLARDEAGAARAYVDGLLAAEPENRLFRYLDAALIDHSGDHSAAAEIYRTLLAEDAGSARIWLELVRSLIRAEETEAAETAIAAALDVHPRAGNLLWARASLRERAGDMAGAIEIYRTLYEDNAGSLIVANNLASLLTTTRDDPEALEEAYRIARRLRGSDVPAFQDTWGWILYRRGEYDAALAALQPAAEALPGEPLVQYHLAMTYLALDRSAEAAAQFQRVLDVAGDSTIPQIARARDALATLRAVEAN